MPIIAALSIRARLALLTVVALLATLMATAVGLVGIREASASAVFLAQQQLPAVGLIGDVRAGVGNLRRFEKDAFLHTGNPAAIESYLPRWKSTLAQTQSALQGLERLAGEDAASRALVTAIQANLDAYARGFGAVQLRLMRGEFGDATYANAAMEPLKAEIRQLDDKLLALKTHMDNGADAVVSGLHGMQRRLMLALLVAVSVLGVVVGAVAWLTTRSIVLPLKQADEALARLATGDLSQVPEAHGRDEVAGMMRRLGQSQSALRELVQTIHGHAGSLATASSQIAQGNADLSARTERQAASLQQTAASMDQLTATVKNGADIAHQANQMSRAASYSAKQGGVVVDQVVRTMTSIQQSSQRIADITAVIDGIAFQTNILALNAAVEAARAGEQGRGFAVVASEVRTLAQRSASAAREIKSLIGDSVERVESGHRQVQEAGDVMADVVKQVERVSQMMADIHAGAVEQQQGIAQVGQAVSELDRTTQQNAALVEESAAASGSLQHQADQLQAAVAAFRLGTR